MFAALLEFRQVRCQLAPPILPDESGDGIDLQLDAKRNVSDVWGTNEEFKYIPQT